MFENVYLQKVSKKTYETYRRELINSVTSSDNDDLPRYSHLVSTQLLNFPIEQGHHFYMIRNLKSNVIVGSLAYRHFNLNGIKWSKLIEIMIFKPYRKKGFATETMRIFHKEVILHESILISLFVFKHNVSANHLYEKLGYIPLNRKDQGTTMIYFLN